MAFQYKIIQRKNRLKDNQVMQSAMQVNRGRVPIKDELKQLQLECSENVCSIGKKEESEKETRPAEPGSGEDLGI